MKLNILLLGAPGAGKGTQAQLIKEKYNIPHISTGDMFREAIRNKTPIGVLADSYISKGNLVPDDVTIALVKERLSKDDCANGYLLDGFPRTLVQAEALTQLTKDINRPIDLVIDIEVDENKLIDRISGRRMCKGCGASYHIKNLPPKVEGVCDVCGGELYIRKDDNVDALKVRLEAYHTQTQPLINYYAQYGLIGEVNGDTSLENVFKAIVDLIEGDK
jgi:adenylate kinase